MNRVVVLALLCLLTFATSVAAECAWVLWVHSLHTDGSLHEQYFVELSRPTRQECYQEASNYAIPLKEQGYRVVRAPGRPEVFGQKGTERLKYFCLPDTVDPRGPKGK